jgi:hypothetical protein
LTVTSPSIPTEGSPLPSEKDFDEEIISKKVFKD